MDRRRLNNKTELDFKRYDLWGGLSVFRKLPWTRSTKRHYNYQTDRIRKRCYKYLCVLAIILSPIKVLANAVSQSNSGSVTNQNWNVNNGSFHTNQYGGGVVCQGAMMTITPFTTFNTNYRKPYRDYYKTPVYDETDIVGDFDDDGNPIGDGTPDNPGVVLFEQLNYSGTNKDSFALGTGITLNFSIPLDRQYTKKCIEAAQVQNDINKQILKNKELDWHMARLRHCGEKKIAGIRFKKDSPYYDLCSDIEIVPKANQVLPHTHKIDVKP